MIGDDQLERMLNEIARPLVERIVAKVYRDLDAEDVVGDALMDVLRRLRSGGEIRDLRAYAAACAYNRCHERLRERYPARNRLRNQVQYLLRHAQIESAGLAAAIRNLRPDPHAENRPQIIRLAMALMHEAGGSLDLDDLVSRIAQLIGLEQQRVDVPLASLAQTEPRADAVLEQRASLRQLWLLICQLVPKQRAALLLNLAEVHLLPLTRTATIAEIASVVELPAETFARLWPDLPLDDAAIAKLLGLTPRQIIKLRRLARERLRRMAERSRLELHISTAT